jgi:hypothetical protein
MVLGKIFSGLGGAASGAAAGSAFGPIGTGIGALVGGLGSLGGSSSGGGGAGNMGGMSKAFVPKPLATPFGSVDDAGDFLAKYQEGAFGGLRRDDALDMAMSNLSPFDRNKLLTESDAAQGIVGFQYDPKKRGELASVFSRAAFGGDDGPAGFAGQVGEQAEALGANTPEAIQRLAFNAAARTPQGMRMAPTKYQSALEAQYGQLGRGPKGALTGKYLVGDAVEALSKKRLGGAIG